MGKYRKKRKMGSESSDFEIVERFSEKSWNMGR